MGFCSKMSSLAAALCLVVLVLSVLVQFSSAQNSPKDYVDAMNKAREPIIAGVNLLKWNHTLVAYSKAYAKKRLATCSTVRTSEGPYGRNLAKGKGNFSGLDAVKLWLKEEPYYDPTTNSCTFNHGGECRDYIQVIWGDTARVGCAREKCNSGEWFVICSFDPPASFVPVTCC